MHSNLTSAVAGRLPGRCLPGDFDCGFGRCVPITSFHDGKPDCYDGSDEWCFFGQVKCGAYCVDVSQAFSCLFSSRCDDSKNQPPWCSVSKEKLCGDPRAFPCRGYGECVLWPWLLDGEKHCIDGSDEDQLYVRALEFSFRCYYNRTKQVAMPPPLNYTDAFLKLTNPIQLPDVRPPQFPTLFPPLPILPSPDLYLTSSPSFTRTPPVQLSKITGLPPLPPPFPTLLPITPSINPSVVQLGPNPVVPTEQTVLVPDSIVTPDDPFAKLSRPLSTSNPGESNPGSDDLIASSSSQGTSDGEHGEQGLAPSTPKLEQYSTENTADLLTTTEAIFTTTAPSEGYPNEMIPLPDLQGTVNPKFRTTSPPQIDQIDNDYSDHSVTSNEINPLGHQVTTDSNAASSASLLPNPGLSESAESTVGYSTTTTLTTTTITVMNSCLMDLIRTSQNRYASRECQCPTGEMFLNEHCEVKRVDTGKFQIVFIVASEDNLAFYKLDIRSACDEDTLTPEQKKWIAIGKVFRGDYEDSIVCQAEL
ncbi:Low-density lipoprotein receptor domain class A [Ostertagia ostertagi]